MSAESDTSAARVWMILWKAAKAVERNAVQSVANLGLGLTDFAVLELLLHKGPQPVNEIGRRVFLTSGSATSAVTRLEERRLVHRTGDPADRRTRVVELTPAGRKTIEQAFARHAEDMEETLVVLSREDRLRLIRLLKKAGLHAESRLEKLGELQDRGV